MDGVDLNYLRTRDINYAVFCQGPYDESIRYHDFMGRDMPWYSAQHSAEALLAPRPTGTMYLVCYLRDGDRVFETYWTTGRGVEAMDYSDALMDLTVYGRQEEREDSPPGWPQTWTPDSYRWRTTHRVVRGSLGDLSVIADPPHGRLGRPAAQWSRLEAGRSDDLGTAER